ncbi:hypothetical protein J3Q64DRAFT_1751289 [Phycomyces blakesleeanus]|uniref:Uncharacterized protein n=2 Tax=Phycomyces blakesleeanus TaxID=4837 RepID=A0A167PQP6_PHYB8|nr:hypothetical protein PHYBLDRAFT_140462 [Phycomyces blakesleeanus NRRL 1555(-)]OAD78364.1 hypothetical protein PHYBLDRAFT_140462 [Phycomyces blakesleeanus NRRL 1555(-)]|eukprot:XP_018296404.1 hypothetical protein PHYBLDRAFT_140462 [Phycomyces blakesleeanus NRRL 1555(-)]
MSASIEPTPNSALETDDSNNMYGPVHSVAIHGQSVSPNILVALLNRPREMQDLAVRNSFFYEAIENYIRDTQGDSSWDSFQHIVYAPREEMSDRVWMASITDYLGHHPAFLGKFKESVGYQSSSSEDEDEEDGDDETEDDDEDDEVVETRKRAPKLTLQPYPRRHSHNHVHYHPMQSEPHPSITSPTLREEEESRGSEEGGLVAGLVALRAHPDIQVQLPERYPAFFQRARRCMGSCIMSMDTPRFQTADTSEDSFEPFITLISTTRRQQPDDGAWMESILEILKCWPELIDELSDIIDDSLPRRRH